MKSLGVTFLLMCSLLVFVISVSVIRGLAPDESMVLLPVVISPPQDLSIDHIEITQAIQTPTNNVPLVEGRPTVARIYARNSVASIAETTISLSASRNGISLGSITIGPQVVPASYSRADINSSFNVRLPYDWLHGDITMQAMLDPNNEINETDETNNSYVDDLNFIFVPPLNLTIVPVNFTDKETGKFYPAPTMDRASDWIMRMYPIPKVNTVLRTPIDYHGSFYDPIYGGWLELIVLVMDIKELDGVPYSTVYYGYVSNGNFSRSSAGGGGNRLGVGLDYGPGSDKPTSMLAAHEVGHGLKLNHAPCGVGAVEGYFPYPEGIIGHYGLDVSEMKVYPPTQHDFMSYCKEWVSDFHYNAMIRDQLITSDKQRIATQPSLFVRVNIAPNGDIVFLPIYEVLAPPSVSATVSDFTMVLLDTKGRELSSKQVEVQDINLGESNATWRRITSLLSIQPGDAVSGVQLMHKGKVIAEKQLSSPAANNLEKPVLKRGNNSSNVNVSWNSLGRPAIVQFVEDNNNTRITLGIDVTDGDVVIDLMTLPYGIGHFEIILADQLNHPPILSERITNNRED